MYENTGDILKSVTTMCGTETTAVFPCRKLSWIFHISPKPRMFELHKELHNLGWHFLHAFTLNRHKVPGEENGDEHNSSGGEGVEWTSLQLLGNITF